jgi:hypothetical protein
MLLYFCIKYIQNPILRPPRIRRQQILIKNNNYYYGMIILHFKS